MANGPPEETPLEGAAPQNSTEPLELNTPAPLAPPATPRKRRHWSFYALMWFLGIAAFALVAVVVMNWNRQPAMDPAQAAAVAWGETCAPSLESTCGGDTVFFKDGHRFTVDGTAEATDTFNALVTERFADVRNIVSLEDCPPSPYCDMLFARYHRTRAHAPEPPVAHAPLPPLPETEPAGADASQETPQSATP